MAFGQSSVASTSSQQPQTTYDLASFQSELQRLSRALGNHPSTNKMAELRDSLPKRWTITTSEGAYNISSQPLRNQLTTLSSTEAKVWVDNLEQEIETSSETGGAEARSARARLEGILARKEFSAVRPPSAWELLKQRIRLWIERQLLRLLGSIGRHPIGGQILFWLILVGGVLAIGVWVFRLLTRGDQLAALPRSELVGVTRSWQEWLRAAREAANRGDFREAVHSAYWAGIARLEDVGVVPRDRTKTPREYLRLATEPAPAALAAAAAPQRPLAGLTSTLERVWYARREAVAEDYRESLRQLEALGCQLD